MSRSWSGRSLLTRTCRRRHHFVHEPWTGSDQTQLEATWCFHLVVPNRTLDSFLSPSSSLSQKMGEHSLIPLLPSRLVPGAQSCILLFPHLSGPQPRPGLLPDACGSWPVSPLYSRPFSTQLWERSFRHIDRLPPFMENPLVASHCTQEVERFSSPGPAPPFLTHLETLWPLSGLLPKEPACPGAASILLWTPACPACCLWGPGACLPAPLPWILVTSFLQVPSALLAVLCPFMLAIFRWEITHLAAFHLEEERMIHRDPPFFPQSWGFCIGDFSVSYFFLTFWSIKRAEAVVVVGGGAVTAPPGVFSDPYSWLVFYHVFIEQRKVAVCWFC